jgi:hypothetical protein
MMQWKSYWKTGVILLINKIKKIEIGYELTSGCWEFKLMLNCPCACCSESETCIIDDAGRPAALKKQRKYMFFGGISPNNVLYSNYWLRVCVVKGHLRWYE